MWQFSSIGHFLRTLRTFFLRFIYCFALRAKFLLPGCNFFLEPIYCWTLFVDNWALFHSNHLVTLLATSKKILGHVPGVSYHANHEDLQACPALDWPPVHRLHPQEQLQGARPAHALPRHGCPHLLQPLLLR